MYRWDSLVSRYLTGDDCPTPIVIFLDICCRFVEAFNHIHFCMVRMKPQRRSTNADTAATGLHCCL